MSKSIEKISILDINYQKLFFLYREKLESIIPTLTNSSIKEIKQISYDYIEDDNFDENYKNHVNILRKWFLKNILPSTLSSIIPPSLNMNSWYDESIWSGVDYSLLAEDLEDLKKSDPNNLNLIKTLEELLNEDQDLICSYKTYSSKDKNLNFYSANGQIKFEKFNEFQTKLTLSIEIEVYYDYLKEKFSIFKSNDLLESFVNNILDFVAKEIEKNLSLIAKEISEKYK